jgi:hypothetical protein
MCAFIYREKAVCKREVYENRGLQWLWAKSQIRRRRKTKKETIERGRYETERRRRWWQHGILSIY